MRQESTVAPQSLMMLNDTFVAEQARCFADRLLAEHPGDLRAQLKRAWRLVYGVDPKDGEMGSSLVYLAEQAEQIRALLAGKTDAAGKDKPAVVPPDSHTSALASLCQALISANRFLYIE
jgi:hypothetical protein